MYETEQELAELQELIDRSFARSSEHLLSIMEPQRRLGADRLSADIPSPAVLNLATVTAKGEPRISAVDGHFLHGRWYFSTDASAVKAGHLSHRRAVSAAYTPKDGYGVFCHGEAVLLEGVERQSLIEHMAATYGSDPEEWGEIVGYRIDAHWITAFAMTAEEVSKIEEQRSP